MRRGKAPNPAMIFTGKYQRQQENLYSGSLT